MEKIAIILGAVACVSEALALIPALKSNGLLDWVRNVANVLRGKLKS